MLNKPLHPAVHYDYYKLIRNDILKLIREKTGILKHMMELKHIFHIKKNYSIVFMNLYIFGSMKWFLNIILNAHIVLMYMNLKNYV